jgi:hypothetical protein
MAAENQEREPASLPVDPGTAIWPQYEQALEIAKQR